MRELPRWRYIWPAIVLEAEAGIDLDTAFGKLAEYERQAEWEAFVSRFQDADPGSTSAEKWLPCERIFSLDECP